MVIEDNEDDQLLLFRMLKKARLGIHVKVVRDGRKALDHLTDHKSKAEELVAVFLDLNLPSITGLRLLAHIRTDDRLRHLSVIVMTSSNSPEDLHECRRLGVSSYVQKPLSLASFTKAIANIFDLPSDAKRPLEKTGLVE